MDYKDGNVHLKRLDNNETVVMPLADLSDADREMILFFAED